MSVNQDGISASSGTVIINITSTSIFAINVVIDTHVAEDTGNTSITLNGNVSTNLGAGVNAVSSSTGSMFIGGTGNIGSTLGDGIVAKQTAAATSGNLTINTSGNIIAQSGASNGIIAQITNAANNADISVTHSGTNTSGLIASTVGGGNVTVNTSKDIGGLFAINVGTTSGDATINVSGGTLAPAFTGILASAATSGNVVVNMTGGQIGTATVSVNQEGISASSGTGSINITSTSIFATNGGIDTQVAGGAGNTSITLNGNVSTNLGAGVNAVSSSTGSMFIGGTGNIGSTLGDGIVAKQTAAATSGNLTINTSGNIIAQSGASNGIIAQITNAANNADISVTHSGTNTSGLIASTVGGGNVTVNTSKDIGGLFAINVGTTSGDATINVSGGTLAPAFTGILASAATSGNVVVNMTGGQIGTATVSVNQEGISASSGTGSINITSTSIFATNGGIDASAGGAISVQNNGAVITSAGIGVHLVGGTTKMVTNLGSVLAPTGVVMTAGSASVFNAGMITGTGGTAI